MNRAISRPQEILVAFIETTLLGEFRIERSNDLMSSGRAPAYCRLHFRSAWGLWPPPALQYRGGIANVSRNGCECF
jgi:hypothetical protein